MVAAVNMPRLWARANTGDSKVWIDLQLGVAAAFFCVTLTTVIGTVLLPYLKHRNICLLYLLAVLYVSSKFDWFPSLLTAFLSLIAYNYFVDPPRFSLYSVEDRKSVV